MKKMYALLLTCCVATVTTHAAVKTTKHKIKKGETLYTIAHKHHTTIAEVRKANALKKGEILKIGRVLTVPENTYFPNKKSKSSKNHFPSMAKHSIKKGETLFSIARKHHTTIAEVRKTNGLKKGETLKIGRVLNVPQNTYNAPQNKIVKVDTRKVTRSDKKLAASLTKLQTINLNAAKEEEEETTFFNSLFASNSSEKNLKASEITCIAKQKLGNKYVWGATGKKDTFDCSGFTSYVYKKNGIDIPRTSINQSKFGKFVPKDQLKKGDLVFFDTSKKRKGYVNHVGIYLGDGKFIHASSAKKKVVITKLANFYAERYKGARRPS